MTAILPSRAGWLVVGLAVLTLAGLGLHAMRDTAPAVQPVAEAPACSSCDARHARLSDLRAKQSEGTE
jgi:hypothetical protein